ncbi:(Fe-S)-binding protein [Helicobacter japonicus]|uniref:Glycolate oxidase iron-sulfur subunit n=1 Tax=Helicobacter japonicus TaxID=425400 RepID=A0A4V6I3D3_9HELI|nr:(Fe-S)-binding protein [Helicobacter japonicus]TLD99542.1 (Fe-S)-binding protein [Helicobacter japonicus]
MLDLQQTASACVKCGKCIPHCTIYMVNRDEVTSPRGFLDLLGAYKRGDIELDSTSKDIFESCFLCTTCVTHCPSSLPVDVAIESVRVDIAQKYGIAWYKRAYFYLLRHRKMADFVFKFMYFLMPCAFKQENGRLISRFKFFKNENNKLAKRSVFPIWRKSFLQQYQGEITPRNPTPPPNTLTHKRVAIFIGCLSNYNYVNVGESLLEILSHLGIKAFVPHLQECCGAPAFFTGDVKSVAYLAKRNIEYFESFWESIDAMIIPEATCAAMIKKDWIHALSNEPEWIERLNKLLPKIDMASSWLFHNTPLQEILPQNFSTQSVTYHDPCHARKVLGIFKEPRTLLEKSFVLKEMSDSARCCGFGGISMQSSRYDLTLKAGKPKAEMIESSGAQVVSAECGACRMQIDNALTQIDSKVRFAHPLELIAQALKKS